MFKRWGFDYHEKKFMLTIPKLSSSDDQSRQKIRQSILVQMPNDYYYLCLFFVATKFLRDNKNDLSGLWPQNVMSAPRAESLQKIRRIIRQIFNILDKNKWQKLYSSIGITNFFTLEVSFWQAFKNNRQAKLISYAIKSKKDVLALKLNGIYCGDLIYDTYLRFRVQPTVDITDPYLVTIITQCLNAQAAFRKQINKNKYDVFLSSYSSYIQHGIPVREAIRADITVFTSGNLSQYFKKLSSDDYLHAASHWNYKKQFDSLTNYESKREAAKLQLESRFNGQIDSATQYMKSSAYASTDSVMPVNIDAVVFLHDFFDSPHCYRDMLFEDFWEWANFTLNIIDLMQLNIAVKPHPNQLAESIEVVNKLKNMYPNIVWLDPKISNMTIFKSGIKCGISVYGTILHELAYNGISALAAGDHPHISFNIATTPLNVEDYRNCLINFKSLKTSENIKNEVLDFYYMHNLYEKEDLQIDFKNMNLRTLEQNNSIALTKFIETYKQEESKI